MIRPAVVRCDLRGVKISYPLRPAKYVLFNSALDVLPAKYHASYLLIKYRYIQQCYLARSYRNLNLRSCDVLYNAIVCKVHAYCTLLGLGRHK